MSQQPWGSQKHGANLRAGSGWSKCRICWSCVAYLLLNYKTTNRKSKFWFNTQQVCSMFRRATDRWKCHLRIGDNFWRENYAISFWSFWSWGFNALSFTWIFTESLNNSLEAQKLKISPQRFQHHRFGSESGAREPPSSHCWRRGGTAAQSQMVPCTISCISNYQEEKLST